MKTEEPLSATVEEYLEMIYNMNMEDEVVIGARLAEKFGVAPPTVTEMLKRLVRDGYVEMDNRRQVTLTEAGNQAAEAVLRRHRLTERFLVDMLGMQWHQVHEEACRLEHFLSGAVEARVITTLNHPTTCPHGNPIPGLVPNARSYLKDCGAIRLSTIALGEVVSILLAVLRQLGQTRHVRAVWIGVILAGLASFLAGVALYITIRDFVGSTYQTIFETIAFLVAVILLTTMTFWMQKHSRSMKK